jgi:hypothetical protein
MLEGLTPKTKEALCFLMKKAAIELSDEDIRILNDAITDNRWSDNALADALTSKGFIISRGVITKHRTGKCACAR